MKKSFTELYNDIHLKYAEQIEKEQTKQRGNKLPLYIQTAASIILILFLALIHWYIFIPFAIIICIITYNITVSVIKNEEARSTYYYKTNVIKELITNVFKDAEFIHNRRILPGKYNSKAFGDNFERYRSEDLVITNNQYDLTFGEVHTQVRNADGKGESIFVTSFWGMYGYCNTTKEISANIYITSNKLFGNLNKNKIDMDMPEFEKNFDVYSDNNIVAVQLLTADVMDELLVMLNTLGYMFEVVIENHKMYIRLHTGGAFELQAFEDNMSVDKLHSFYNILEHVDKLTDMVNKNIKELNI